MMPLEEPQLKMLETTIGLDSLRTETSTTDSSNSTLKSIEHNHMVTTQTINIEIVLRNHQLIQVTTKELETHNKEEEPKTGMTNNTTILTSKINTIIEMKENEHTLKFI